VALLSIAATAALTSAMIRAEFDRYIYAVAIEPRLAPPMGAPPWRAMPRMRDPAMQAMMRRAMALPELRFLEHLRHATLLAAVAGTVAAILLAILVARYTTAPLRQLSAAVERVGRGDLSQQVAVPTDDETRRLAIAFNAMTADLRRLEESRRHLVADIAHELGTPLSVLQANLEGMLDGLVTTTPDRLAALHTQVQLLARLVADLRDLSLAHAGRLVLDRRPTDLAALVAEAVAVVLPHAAAKGVGVHSRAVEGLPLMGVDRDRMMQVVHNLLDNAIRHTPAGGVITVDLGIVAGQMRLSVSDTGPGIPPEDVERIFDRFYRLDASRSRARGGAGLGLAIVKSLVEAHGGRVWVASQAGRGATFTVALPTS
jgi:signal transduction histidine kinase